MYNYQKFLKENRIKQKCDNIRKEHQDTIKIKQRRMPSMIQSHKKRIQGFILAMVEKPLQIHQHRQFQYQPRAFLWKNKSAISDLGHPNKTFYLNHHTQKERLDELKKQNQLYDSVPFKNASNHQFRQNNPSQCKPFKLHPSTTSLRVKEELERRTLNCLDYSKNKKVEKLLRANSNQAMNAKSLAKIINKSLLPNLHMKTHFQSVKSIYSQSPCGFLKFNANIMGLNLLYQANQKQNHNEQYDDDTEFQVKKQHEKGSNDHANRKQNSKEALIKCGLLKIVGRDNQASTISQSRMLGSSLSKFNVKKMR